MGPIRAKLWLVVSLSGVTGCTVPLVEGLEESSASDVVVTLAEHDIGAVKVRDPDTEGGYRVEVATDDVAAALAILHGAGLPEPHIEGVLDALGDGALVPSRMAERARLLVGTSGELERSLREVSGVLGARVHLAVPERDPLTPELAPPPSAAVLLRHAGVTPPLPADEVRWLVAGAVSGLRPEAVTVVMHPVTAKSVDAAGRLTQLGSLSLTRSSAVTLRAWIIGVAALNLLMVLGMVWQWTRLKRAQRVRDPGKPSPSESAP